MPYFVTGTSKFYKVGGLNCFCGGGGFERIWALSSSQMIFNLILKLNYLKSLNFEIVGDSPPPLDAFAHFQKLFGDESISTGCDRIHSNANLRFSAIKSCFCHSVSRSLAPSLIIGEGGCEPCLLSFKFITIGVTTPHQSCYWVDRGRRPPSHPRIPTPAVGLLL